MRIKKNDTVLVLSGKDKGKRGKVVRAYPEIGRVVVEGVNIRAKHVRQRRSGEKGQKIFFPGPLSISKVMLVCQKCGKPTRVRYRVIPASERLRKKKERVCKKCHQPTGE